MTLEAILLLLLGAFLFGTMTVLNLIIYNGMYAALMIRDSLLSGINPISVVLLILLHGIFEIPAIIIAGAAASKYPAKSSFI